MCSPHDRFMKPLLLLPLSHTRSPFVPIHRLPACYSVPRFLIPVGRSHALILILVTDIDCSSQLDSITPLHRHHALLLSKPPLPVRTGLFRKSPGRLHGLLTIHWRDNSDLPQLRVFVCLLLHLYELPPRTASPDGPPHQRVDPNRARAS